VLLILSSQVVTAMENAGLYENLRENYFRTVQALVAAVEAKDPIPGGIQRMSPNMPSPLGAIWHEPTHEDLHISSIP
jgi:hypothetical protein